MGFPGMLRAKRKDMIRRTFLLSFFFLLPVSEASGEGEPSERRAILDALRPVVQNELEGPVQFVVSTLRTNEG